MRAHQDSPGGLFLIFASFWQGGMARKLIRRVPNIDKKEELDFTAVVSRVHSGGGAEQGVPDVSERVQHHVAVAFRGSEAGRP
ncbi:hypothetical protein [Streptomyces sp. NPDC057381]|uniref:hypothetical protein n=1 Tax=Streptomyces sp. NPDC057381 TaxID=3346111 RepID=UPI00363C53E5